MGRRRFPPLCPAEVVSIVVALGFAFKRQDGSHAHYERPADAARTRALVTVDMSVADFWEDIIKSMIRQSGFTREQFYCATEKTAKKIR
jgi:predicted RNA binding protein YcfA (HicA-like mRNA interferase family)